MNKTLLSLIFVFILIGCKNHNQKTNADSNSVIIAGKILNYQNHPDKYTVKIHERNLCNHDGIKHVEFIDDNGNFKFEFTKLYTSDIFLRYGKMLPILVGPGDSLFVEFDADEFLDNKSQRFWECKTLEFSGDRMLTNEQIRIFNSLIMSNEPISQLGYNEDNLLPEEYLNYLTTRKSEWERVLDSLNQNQELTDEFINWSRLYIDYKFGWNLLHYTWHNSSINGKKSSFYVPKSFKRALENISFDKEEYTICSAYNHYLHEHFYAFYFFESSIFNNSEESIRKFYKSNLFEDEFRKLLKEIEERYHGIAKEVLISRELFQLLDSYDRQDIFEKLYPDYKNVIRKNLLSTLDEKYAKIKSKENSSLTNKNIRKTGKEFKSNEPDVLAEIIENNKGKVIYIDFWATYCGPCLSEFPNSKKLHKELIDQDVEFVYLCVNSKKENWEEKLSEYNLDGSHYLLTDSQSDILSEKFQISGIPHYVLIDKKGTVAKNGSHLRPNVVKDEIIDLLNK